MSKGKRKGKRYGRQSPNRKNKYLLHFQKALKNKIRKLRKHLKNFPLDKSAIKALMSRGEKV